MDSQTAFKASFTKDTTFNFNPHAFLDELSTLNLQNATPSDDFFVEELLDFSHHQQEQEEEEDEPKNKNDSVSVSLSPQQTTQSRHFCNLPSTFSLKDDFVSTELTVPAEDEADLEWLSHFVEDSFLEHPSAYPTGTTSSDKPQNGFRPQTPVSTRQPCFEAPVPAKARSKRTRSGVRVWPLGSPSFTDSSSSNSSSSSSPSSPCLIYTGLTQNLEPVSSPAAKKWKRRTAAEAAATAPRRCSHCGVQKTPQWRTGPLGAKTLCNACGVRFKSGRLLPEYRPACSPTFSSELHSNHHRKVLEMRRKKEVGGAIGLGSDHFPVVPSF
ncbi:GATA transcription factor 5 [Senna tora]|uniref:GATA transcription factor n=1 Tax=Senna tora TaxID=362788 RepID=A0A834SXF5_9FABA|nr:GATA transcription factor 5 [Senna tora]